MNVFRIGCRFLSSTRPVWNAEIPGFNGAVGGMSYLKRFGSKKEIPPNSPKTIVKRIRRKESRLKKQIVRDVNNLKQHEVKNVQLSVDPVLGDPKCAFIQRIFDEVADHENHLAYGVDKVEFEKLMYGVEKANLEKLAGTNVISSEQARAMEEKKKRALLTILNLRNSNSFDKRKLAIRLAREEFQRFDGDTGSPEVQAAVLTVKIHFAMKHVKENRKDFEYIQQTREMVQYRQRLLKYLKKDNPERYFYTIHKLGLADDVVHCEFNMGRQYFQDYKVWGDRQLVKLSEKQQKKIQKVHDLKRRVEEYQTIAKKNYELAKQATTKGSN
ncbi:uncharacterized protein SPAPADRAFT_49526 [Spathaspora passalidarum NRRL Y-27907]|uniref:Uncharacterized protein n=1 Tax=Spathaspora passalidarum (strain NRRL Y-27907 / 11-Y1) TaxID=619300 RepID=G3AIR9_SPAPN|nr:uncharacterized protein SPAPADRAFT_49526 [Spathaspora passalidarum NRRL Y-27907]EGW34486.1 hypothetical protein SPAPADRAFT_49526 [Spathaspora passalidarum NRRL Y-27907]